MSQIEVREQELVIPENFFDARQEYELVRKTEHDVAVALDFRRLLKQVDARLDLMFVKAGTRVFPKGERYYITRRNEGVQPSFWLVEDEHGEFCVPDQRHLDRLQ